MSSNPSRSQTVYLVTGANRGLGRGLVSALLLRDSTTVVAGVRDPNDSTAESLNSLPTGSNSCVIVVKIISTAENDAATAVKVLQSQHGLDHIDVVIANAGIAKHYGSALETPLAEVREHFEVNALGVLILFQATWPLLEKSALPKFVAISTGLSTIGGMEQLPMPVTAYGSSKAAMNFIVRKIHFENEKLIAFPLSPGWVQTDMGNSGAQAQGMEQAPVKLEDSVRGQLEKIDNATRETSGTFQDFQGQHWDW